MDFVQSQPCSVNNQLLATRDTWLTWFMVSRSVNTSVDHRPYAEVLQSGCKRASVLSRSNHVGVHNGNGGNSIFTPGNSDKSTDCVPSKSVPGKRNVPNFASNHKGSDFKRNHSVRGEPHMQESSIAVCNRYQALQSSEDIDLSHLSHQHGSSLETQLEGNKNKTRKKLDQKPCYNNASSVTNSTFFKGNKNKTGRNWVWSQKM